MLIVKEYLTDIGKYLHALWRHDLNEMAGNYISHSGVSSHLNHLVGNPWECEIKWDVTHSKIHAFYHTYNAL